MKHRGIAALNRRDAQNAILMALIRANGAVRLSKSLAHAMGLRRRELRGRVNLLIDDGEPLWRFKNDWVGLIWGRTRITLDLTDDDLVTLVAALRHTQNGAQKRSHVAEAAHLQHRIAAQLPLAQFQRLQPLGQFDVLPTVVADDGRATTPVRNLVTDAVRAERKLHFLYTDAGGARSDRIVWPVTVTHHGMVLVGWCELRRDFRHFRLDQMAGLVMLDAAFPRSRAALLTEWRGQLPSDGPRAEDDDDPA